MFQSLGYLFTQIISTMDSVLIIGEISLLDFSIGLAVFGLAVSACRAIFSAGGDN